MSDAVSLSPVQDSGFVTVTLVSARGLMGKNSDSKSDPFCIIEIGSQVHFSKIKKATCDPIWNETYVFDIPMPLPAPFYLNVSVWNQPKFSNGRDTKGAFLGQLSIDLEQVGRSEANGRFFELEKRSARSHVSGGLEMKIAITSENDAAKMRQQERDRARALQQAMQKQLDDEQEAHSAEILRQANAKQNLDSKSKARLKAPEDPKPDAAASMASADAPGAASTSRPNASSNVSAEQLAAQKLRKIQNTSREKTSIYENNTSSVSSRSDASVSSPSVAMHQHSISRASEASTRATYSGGGDGDGGGGCCSCFKKKPREGIL